MTDRVGQQFGHYRLLRLLGQGSFAAVYLGEHLYLERPAAIKVLHVQMDPKTQEAFRCEARTIARLQHPHIVQVHDFGLEGQTPYLVMEYTPGGTLQERYPKGTCLTSEQIITTVKQIASALDYAHQQQVIHRDIKPANLLLNAKGEVVLSDFGIAVVERTLESLFWIEGVLFHSLHGAALMTLGLQTQPDAVADPWHLVLQHPDAMPHPLPTGTRILQVYDNVDGELLILGAPGAGKTTLLLELARDLLTRAQADEEYPLPVVFNLSSWVMKQQPLVDWLAEELGTKYQVPSKLAQALLCADQILPLLDGLDEVALTARTACIEAINIYRREHGLLPLVVCSRQADYLAQSGRLLVRSAVAVQPLTQEQVDAYLVQGGEPLWALRVALHQDAALRELTSTPLMLSILMLTYSGRPVEELLRDTSLEERQRQVFEQYVKRMLTRRGPLQAGTTQQVVQWLSFLAQRMRTHHQTIFYLEWMQPDWLPSKRQRQYLWSLKGVIGLLTGLIIGPVTAIVMVPTDFEQLIGLVVRIVAGLFAGLGLG